MIIETKHTDVRIPLDKINLEGDLTIPVGAKSLVIFSHGSGSSRFSTRNNLVAWELQKHKIATFLFDLLTKEEDEVYANRFDIALLTNRLVEATRFIETLPQCSGLPVGYFGASTGAASALRAAAALPQTIKAIVSRGGRPDLAIDVITQVKAPTLLIVGERDHDVLKLNHLAFNALTCGKRLTVVPNATHLFEERGALQEVSEHAIDWFDMHLHNNKV